MPAIHSFQLAHPSMRMHTHKLNYVIYERCSIEIEYNLKCLFAIIDFFSFTHFAIQNSTIPLLLYYILDSNMISFPSCLCFSIQS